MQKTEGIPVWQQLELLVAAIQKQLAPDAKVSHNVKLHGQQSETTRQIDVLVEQAVGQYGIRIVIDCKDYKDPVDVKGVEEFHGLMVDVGAHKGVMVCPKGFTHSAKKRAKKFDMDLFSPVDTDPHKWQVSAMVPTICDFRATGIAFGVSSSAPLALKLPDAFYLLDVLNEAGESLGTILEVAGNGWNDGRYPIEPGAHEKLPLLADEKTTIDNGYGTHIPVDLSVSLHVTRQRYFGHLPITDLHGFKDEQTGQTITNAFKFKLLDAVTVQNQWTKLGDEEAPPTPAVLEVVGLHCWGAKPTSG
jgi:hypothetical protein